MEKSLKKRIKRMIKLKGTEIVGPGAGAGNGTNVENILNYLELVS